MWMPCQWIALARRSPFSKATETRPPARTRISGPGVAPLKPSIAVGPATWGTSRTVAGPALSRSAAARLGAGASAQAAEAARNCRRFMGGKIARSGARAKAGGGWAATFAPPIYRARRKPFLRLTILMLPQHFRVSCAPLGGNAP